MNTPSKAVGSRRFRRPRTRYWVLGALAAVTIGTASLLPGQTKALLHTSGRLHTSLHMVAFATVAYFVFRAVRTRSAHVLLVGAAFALGFASELAEHAIYGSPMEYSDVGADCAGVLVGSTLAASRHRMRTRRSVAA